MRVLLTRNHSLSSALIRMRLGENWSHGLVAISDGHCIDSTFKLGGVRMRPLADPLVHATNRCELHIPLDSEAAASDWLHAQVGKAYDWRALVGFASLDREWRDDSSWFCFELIAGAIEAGSLYRFDDLARVGPRELFDAARALQGAP